MTILRKLQLTKGARATECDAYLSHMALHGGRNQRRDPVLWRGALRKCPPVEVSRYPALFYLRAKTRFGYNGCNFSI